MFRLLERLTDQFTDANQSMSIFTRDTDTDDGTNWESTPFTLTAELQGKCAKSIEKYAERGASRLYRELTTGRDTTLQDVSTSWFDVGETGYSPKGLYFQEIGPVVATADGVTWNRAFTMDLDEAPAFKSDRWKEIASEYQLSNRDVKNGVVTVISCAYNELEKATKRNDGFRAMHTTELRPFGPAVTDRSFEKAMDCLAQWDGVSGPTDGPAWEYVDPTVETDTKKSATEETPA